MADINLRLIQQDSMQDRVNYFALQKSIALFPNIRYADKRHMRIKCGWISLKIKIEYAM